ncbi:chaplin, partial [Streptomyces resistomycificus]
MVAAAAATSILSLCGSSALADVDGNGTAKDSPGVLSGNSVQAPVEVPVNVCGNSVDVAAGLNPTFGNSCANGSGSHKSGSRAADHGDHDDLPGFSDSWSYGSAMGSQVLGAGDRAPAHGPAGKADDHEYGDHEYGDDGDGYGEDSGGGYGEDSGGGYGEDSGDGYGDGHEDEGGYGDTPPTKPPTTPPHTTPP